MKQPTIVEEILAIVDPNELVARVRDVGVACAMARMGEAEPRSLLKHLLDVVEVYTGDKTDPRWQTLVGLVDIVADEIRYSQAPNDEYLVSRINALMQDTLSHHHGGMRDAE